MALTEKWRELSQISQQIRLAGSYIAAQNAQAWTGEPPCLTAPLSHCRPPALIQLAWQGARKAGAAFGAVSSGQRTAMTVDDPLCNSEAKPHAAGAAAA